MECSGDELMFAMQDQDVLDKRWHSTFTPFSHYFSLFKIILAKNQQNKEQEEVGACEAQTVGSFASHKGEMFLRSTCNFSSLVSHSDCLLNSSTPVSYLYLHFSSILYSQFFITLQKHLKQNRAHTLLLLEMYISTHMLPA